MWQTTWYGEATLVRIGDTPLAVADPAEDVRGRPVLDRHSRKIGRVTDLLVDPGRGAVRYLRVASGGAFGLGTVTLFIPVGAVIEVFPWAVHIDPERGGAEAAALRYDPELATAGGDRDGAGDDVHDVDDVCGEPGDRGDYAGYCDHGDHRFPPYYVGWPYPYPFDGSMPRWPV